MRKKPVKKTLKETSSEKPAQAQRLTLALASQAHIAREFFSKMRQRLIGTFQALIRSFKRVDRASTRVIILVVLAGVLLITLITSSHHLAATVLPTNTPAPLSVTVSTDTPTVVMPTGSPTSTPVYLGGLVKGTPVPLWKDIPLAPGATAGNENSRNYLYTTSNTPSEVVAFYAQEMLTLGWTPRGGNGTPDPSGAITLVFYKGQEVCLVGITRQKIGSIVMLGRQANAATATRTAAPLPTKPTVTPTVNSTLKATAEPTVTPTVKPTKGP